MIGFDKYEINNLLYLSLPLTEGVGAIANDISKLQYAAALNGPPTWENVALSGCPYLDFDSTTPDWLECPAADALLNFTAGDFTLLAWVWLDDLSANRCIFCRGLLDTDGYHCEVLINGSIVLYTNQAAASQSSSSAAASVATGAWYLVGFTREGDSVKCYNNGSDVTDTIGTHIDPLTSARDLHIGIYDNETGSPWEGRMWNPRIWARTSPPEEMRMIWNYEKVLFGV